MNPFFDPSKMDPQVLMEMSQLVQQLPPEKLNKLQSLMHNMMAGFDVKREMEEFERELPPGFREKLTALMMRQGAMPGGMGNSFGAGAEPPRQSEIRGMASGAAPTAAPTASTEPAREMDMHEARMTILRAVSQGQMSPEEAEKLLFPT